MNVSYQSAQREKCLDDKSSQVVKVLLVLVPILSIARYVLLIFPARRFTRYSRWRSALAIRDSNIDVSYGLPFVKTSTSSSLRTLSTRQCQPRWSCIRSRFTTLYNNISQHRRTYIVAINPILYITSWISNLFSCSNSGWDIYHSIIAQTSNRAVSFLLPCHLRMTLKRPISQSSQRRAGYLAERWSFSRFSTSAYLVLSQVLRTFVYEWHQLVSLPTQSWSFSVVSKL